MPLYEYRCQECDELFELLVRRSDEQDSVACPKCGATRVRRAISLFGFSGGSGEESYAGPSCGPAPT